MTEVKDAELLRLIIHGTTAFELLRTGLDLDVFQQLEDADGMTVPALAEALGVQPKPARILLLGLASMGLLARDGERYVNTEVTRRKLLRGSPRYLGPLVDIQARIINPSMADLTESVRQNTNAGLRHLDGPGSTLYERLTAHPELQQVFYDNMGDASQKAFSIVLDVFDFSTVRHVVDIGGGDGTNSIELVQRFPDVHATVFDQESVTEIARKKAEQAGVAERVHAAPGDMFRDQFPAVGDAVLFFHIFEVWSLERNTELLRKCYDALPDGGRVLVYNFVSNDEGTGPMTAGFMSAYFLALATGEGMVYSAQDMKDAIRAAGFRDVEVHGGLGFHHALAVGTK
jgi:cyclopropane fatty-acyl-phospholipid synthase-like methyltransferase